MKEARLLIVLCAVVCCARASAAGMLSWHELSALPAPEDESVHLGVAGPFAGIHNDALIIAGGANFPQPIWETSKVWHDAIHVLVKEDANYRWVDGGKLDRPLAYGASVSTGHGVLCMGGNDAERTYADVFLLQREPETETITQQALPSLPTPCAYSGAAMIGDTVYLAGGTSELGLETAQKSFWSLDLSQLGGEGFAWRQLESWPGPARAFAIVAAQHNGIEDCVYVMSGRRIGDSGEIEFLTDVYEYAPNRAEPWRRRADVPRCVMAGTGIGVGQSHVMVLGGADGSLFHQADILKDEHPGFPKEALTYHTITDTWTSAGSMPANHVTTVAVRWGTDTVNDPIVIPAGEIRPRVRSPKIWQVLPVEGSTQFGAIDFSAIALYLAAMVGVGVFFAFRNKNADDFFRGGQRVPWFVAGLSIFATMLSSITFVAIPAKAYATDWVYFMYNMTAIAIAPLVILLFLPFFRKIDATSAYEYLEKRFNRLARMFASASFVLFQIGRMAVVLYLPALALAAITPLNEHQCILLIGGLSILYCALGGLEAVVWTDTVQSFVLLGGALLSFALIVGRVDDGLGGFMATAAEHEKFHIANWDFAPASFATTALWVVVLGGIAQNLVPYTSDMAVVQRYMSVSDTTRAKKAIWTNAIAVLPASLLFFGVGTALFVFYTHHPERLDPTFKTDAIFPLFISRELPVGIAGLVVAGLFAAAQSTVSTSMNSMSTAVVTDFVRPLDWVHSERGYLWLGRVLTVVLGILGMSLALLFASSDIKSLWDKFMEILGLFGGAMCGLFCLGIFTKRANGPGAIVGALVGAAGLFLVQRFTEVHVLLYAFVGISACCIVGYLASFAFPPVSKSIAGLTIHTLSESYAAESGQTEGEMK